MKTGRRAFLVQAAAIPGIFGLRELFAQEAASGTPGWFQKALQRMKETGRCGVVIVAPDQIKIAPKKLDEKLLKQLEGKEELRARLEELYCYQDVAKADASRRLLGSTLWILANEDFPAAHELLCEAVFICVTSEIADRTVRKTGDKRNRFLLDPVGHLLAADSVEAAVLENPEKFAPSFAPFLHGEGDVRLRERATAIQKGLDAEIVQALSQLTTDSADERDAATAVLVRRAESIAPFLVHFSLTAPGAEERGRAKDALTRYFASTMEDAAGPRLPFGAYLPKFVESCAGLQLEKDVALDCGLGRAPRKSRKFLLFLLK
jgi:hypothetical protein